MTGTHVHIDTLDLDLRGVDPALAQAAVQLLGPALQARLSGTVPRHGAAQGQAADAHALASHLAERVAGQLAAHGRQASATAGASQPAKG